MLAPIEIMGVERFADSAVVIRARLKTKPIKQWYVGREFNRRMKKLFDARHIEIPYPHRTISWDEPRRREPASGQLQSHNPEALASATEQGERQATPQRSDPRAS
jgi:moderate conductance mechanosensitive channel